MSQLRVRHPGGLATIQINLDSATVQNLQEEIRRISNVQPSQQELKYGYPPRQLMLVPELPVSSLGLKASDLITLTQRPGAAPSKLTSTPLPSASVTTAQATAPVSTMPPRSTSASTGSPEYVPVDTGVLVHRVVPDDNSCLFNAVALVLEQDMSKAPGLRKIVAEGIRSDMETWNEAILGMPREKYVDNMLKPSAWGGAIELSILAKHYRVEIASIDVETGRIDHFEPSNSKPVTRCILIYSGIHYDAATLAPMEDAPPDFHQTVFPINGENEQTDFVLHAAGKLADKLRAKRAYTNTSTFDLRCEICKEGLKGEKGARDHAMQTGHTAFGEY